MLLVPDRCHADRLRDETVSDAAGQIIGKRIILPSLFYRSGFGLFISVCIRQGKQKSRGFEKPM
jgi:hypothetical protein